jgi:hypothetical protein
MFEIASREKRVKVLLSRIMDNASAFHGFSYRYIKNPVSYIRMKFPEEGRPTFYLKMKGTYLYNNPRTSNVCNTTTTRIAEQKRKRTLLSISMPPVQLHHSNQVQSV